MSRNAETTETNWAAHDADWADFFKFKEDMIEVAQAHVDAGRTEMAREVMDAIRSVMDTEERTGKQCMWDVVRAKVHVVAFSFPA